MVWRALCACALLLVLVTDGFAATRLEDLAWMSGTWRGRIGEGKMEEIWTRPEGPSMVGTFRLVEGGAVKFYEFMVIEPAANGPVLRIRHFNGDLTAWEDKSGALPFKMISRGKNRAVFENAAMTPPEKLTYTRVGRHLTILLETTKQGKPVEMKFKFRRD